MPQNPYEPQHHESDQPNPSVLGGSDATDKDIYLPFSKLDQSF